VRPEVVRYNRRLGENYAKPKAAKTLILVPQTETKPFHKSREYKEIRRSFGRIFREASEPHVCFYAAPFGIVPIELDETYPLSQHETAMPLDKETVEHVATQMTEYIQNARYETVILVHDPQNWNNAILDACKRICRKNKTRLKTIFYQRD
jgi:predicted RNA-binding protein